MKVILSPLVAGLSGKAADTVAAKWKGIQYIRKHTIPHNPKTAAQVTQRAYFARMAVWFRSLPSALTAALDALAVGQGKSGYNLMAGLDLKHLAKAENPEIFPANPDANAVFLIVDATSIVDAEINLNWVQGVATTGHFLHVFTCPVDPDEVGLTEPDGWTMFDAPITVQSGSQAAIPVANIAKSYYVVGIVADTDDLTTATVFSGGIGCTVTSGETP